MRLTVAALRRRTLGTMSTPQSDGRYAKGVERREQAGTVHKGLVAASSGGLQLQWMGDKTIDMGRGLEPFSDALFVPTSEPHRQ